MLDFLKFLALGSHCALATVSSRGEGRTRTTSASCSAAVDLEFAATHGRHCESWSIPLAYADPVMMRVEVVLQTQPICTALINAQGSLVAAPL